MGLAEQWRSNSAAMEEQAQGAKVQGLVVVTFFVEYCALSLSRPWRDPELFCCEAVPSRPPFEAGGFGMPCSFAVVITANHLVSCLLSPVSGLLSLVSCLLSPVSCLLSPVSCLLSISPIATPSLPPPNLLPYSTTP